MLRFKVLFNTFIQLLGKFGTALCGLAITLTIARFYGTTGFGEFTKISAYIALFYLVVDFGINAIFLKEEEKFNFANLLSLRLVFGAILIFLALALAAILPGSINGGFSLTVKLGIIVLAPTILTQGIYISFNALFQKNLRYDKSIMAGVGSGVVTAIVIFLFSSVRLPLVLTLSSYLIGGLVLIVASYFLGKKYLKKERDLTTEFLTQDLKKWKVLFKKSLPLGLTLILNLVYFRADVFILTFYRSTIEVGLYGLAYKFFEFPLAFPTFFMNAVYPLMLESRVKPSDSDGKNHESRIIKKSQIFLLISSVLITIICLLLAPLISLVKSDFNSSIAPFRILVLSLPVFFLSSLYMWAIIAKGKQRELLKIYGLGMILNIVLNLIFIPQYGYLAAAITTGVSEAVILGLLWRENKKNCS